MTDIDKTREQLVKGGGLLRQRISELAVSGAERKPAVGKEKRHIRDLEFLSRTAKDFVELSAEADIYEFMGERLHEIVGGAATIVTSFDEAAQNFYVRVLLGVEEHMDTAVQMLGRHPVGMSVPISAEARRGLTSDRLERVPGGLYELAAGAIPKATCHTVKKLLGLGDIYAVGLVWGGRLFGSVAILMRKGARLRNPWVIETFVSEASVALQRWQAEVALRKAHDELELRVSERTAQLSKGNEALHAEIARHRQAHEELEYRAKFDKIAASISTNFVHLALEEIDKGISHALKETAELLAADWGFLILLTPDATRVDNTYEWCANGVQPQMGSLKGVSVDAIPWWIGKLKLSETVYVPHVDDLPPEASAEREILESQDVRSHLVVPMCRDNSLVGLVGFGVVGAEKSWTEGTVVLVKRVGKLLAGTLKGRRLKKVRVVVGEHSVLLRRGICTAIRDASMELLGEADTGEGLAGLVSQYHPDVVVMRFDLPGLSRRSLIRHIKERAPTTDIMVICDKVTSSSLVSVVDAGAAGYLSTSDASADQLVNAILSINDGAAVADLHVVRQLVLSITHPSEDSEVHTVLSSRELEILQLASRGMSNRAIAEHLSLSERSVQAYFHSIYRKMAVRSRTEAVYEALKNAWIGLS